MLGEVRVSILVNLWPSRPLAPGRLPSHEASLLSGGDPFALRAGATPLVAARAAGGRCSEKNSEHCNGQASRDEMLDVSGEGMHNSIGVRCSMRYLRGDADLIAMPASFDSTKRVVSF